MQKAGLPKK